MTHDPDDQGTSLPASGVADELDRLRLALLHERSRAERAEHELAALRVERSAVPELRDEVAALKASTSFRIGSSVVRLSRPFRRRR
jgi:hypothetical protein|nr:hypothetical protein [Aeromicrobium sp.]